MNADTPIGDIGRYGKALASRFKKLGIKTIGDLLTHPPARYEDLSEIKTISALRAGEAVTIQATVELIANRRTSAKRMVLTEAILDDGTGKINALWFSQPYITNILKPGTRASFAGKVSIDRGHLQMISPIYEPGDRSVHTGRIIPIYPTTANLTQKHIRAAVAMALPALVEFVDPLPEKIREKYDLVSFADALHEIHYPTETAKLERARRRLQFDELLMHQLLALRIKNEVKASKGIAVPFAQDKTKEFVDSLPFKLTDDQKKAAWAILKDMEKAEPMHRLLDGDVGSGKTVVAAVAAVNVAASGGQTAIMAPTEVLAKQHYETFKKILPAHEIALRTNVYKEGDETAPIVIGTHALLEDKVALDNLTLAVIDEQHRFGVEQRQELMKKRKDGRLPHLLTMTATPIPRTLHLALYGDLDISLLREKPKNRLPIVTSVVAPLHYKDVYAKVRSEIGSGRQAFFVSPVIDPSDVTGTKSATELYDELSKKIFKDLSVGLLHGRMKPAEKEKTMAGFVSGNIQILVATAVIEVGIDVPNASVMVITGAERFGLAQLHQFRGRVGRSTFQSYCFALSSSETTSQRLRALSQCADGFDLAERDLTLRGPGELFGTRQSGIEEMKFATFTDIRLVEEAHDAASELLAADEDLNSVPVLREKIIFHEQAAHFA
jgi:ATP-dependent DNA helicase RecG